MLTGPEAGVTDTDQPGLPPGQLCGGRWPAAVTPVSLGDRVRRPQGRRPVGCLHCRRPSCCLGAPPPPFFGPACSSRLPHQGRKEPMRMPRGLSGSDAPLEAARIATSQLAAAKWELLGVGMAAFTALSVYTSCYHWTPFRAAWLAALKGKDARLAL